MEKHDIIIVGAGLSGLTAGEMLAKNGKDVLIIEKNSRDGIGDKACAGGCPPHTLDLIPDELLEYKSGSVNLTINRKTLSMKYHKPIFGSISRLKFGQYQLTKAEEAGCKIECDSKVILLDKEKKYIEISNGKKIYYNYLIAADGSNSGIRRSLFKEDKSPKLLATDYIIPNNGNFNGAEIIFDLKNLGLTYGWIFPHKDVVSIGTGSIHKFRSLKSTEESFIKLMKERGIDLTQPNVIKRTASIHWWYYGFAHENGTILLVGDAASFVCVPTSEGIYSAIKSGEVAAKKIMGENIDHDLEKLEIYTKLNAVIPWLFKHPKITKLLVKFLEIFFDILEWLCGLLESRSYKNFILNSVYFGLHPIVHKLEGSEKVEKENLFRCFI